MAKKVSKSKAEKALDKAKKAVKKAKKAVRKSSRKVQNQAAALETRTRSLEKTLKAAQRGASKKKADPAAAAVAVRGQAGVVTPPPMPKGGQRAPTLFELREQAKIRQIPGYSRLNKAALIAALG